MVSKTGKEPREWIKRHYLVQVHLYAPLEKNTRAYRREISRRLVAAGFTRPTVTPASDKNGQHYAFECEIAGGVDDG